MGGKKTISSQKKGGKTWVSGKKTGFGFEAAGGGGKKVSRLGKKGEGSGFGE